MSCGIPGITSFFNQLNDTVDKITSMAGGALCALTNPDAVIEGLAAGVLGELEAQISQLTQLFQSFIQQALNDIFGVILTPLKQFLDFIKQITDTLSCINSCLQSISDKVNDMANLLINNERCKAAAASFGKCIGSRIAQGLTKKIAQKVNSGILSIQELTENVKDNFFKKTNIFEDISKKLSDDANRASIKLNAFTNKI